MLFNLFGEKAKPVKKTGVKKMDKKINSALKKSKGKCINCHKKQRTGASIFCSTCLRSMKTMRKRMVK